MQFFENIRDIKSIFFASNSKKFIMIFKGTFPDVGAKTESCCPGTVSFIQIWSSEVWLVHSQHTPARQAPDEKRNPMQGVDGAI